MRQTDTVNETPNEIHLLARSIPVPTSISPAAQAALKSVRPAMPPFPDVGDKVAWREFIQQINRNFASMIRGLVLPIPGTCTLETLGGVPVYVAESGSIPESNRDKAMIFFLGGGLVMAGGECVELFARLEANKTRCRVYAVDFGNPPDHPFPGALNDGLAVYRALLAQSDASRIVVSGASGGRNLAVTVPLEARDLGLPLPGAIGLFTPEVDLTESGDSFQTNLTNDVNGGDLMIFNALYANGHAFSDPRISPLFADFGKGFAPTLIQTGTRDLFLSNSARLHRGLRKAGIDAELHVGEAMPHGGFGGGLHDFPEDAELRFEFLSFLASRAGWAKPQHAP